MKEVAVSSLLGPSSVRSSRDGRRLKALARPDEDRWEHVPPWHTARELFQYRPLNFTHFAHRQIYVTKKRKDRPDALFNQEYPPSKYGSNVLRIFELEYGVDSIRFVACSIFKSSLNKYTLDYTY